MMKILFLNPHINAEHKALKTLQDKGVALLFAGNADEAWQMLRLHGTSVDLAIVHREGEKLGSEPGLELVAKVKGDPSQADLPLIVTSELWGDPEFVAHQKSGAGANAYLSYPFSSNQLLPLIEAVMGAPLAAAPPSRPPPSAPRPPAATDSALVLEDASKLFARPERADGSDSSIHLDAPAFDVPAFEMPTSPSGPRIPEAPTGTIVRLSPIEGTKLVSSPAEFEAILDAPPPSTDSRSEETSIPTAGNTRPFEPSVVSSRVPSDEPALIAGKAIRKPEEPTPDDPAMSREMPYLFGATRGIAGREAAPEPVIALPGFLRPVGDSVVPGGASHSPDAETLKKYLLLREQDVAALSAQLRGAHDQLAAVQSGLRAEKSRGVEQGHVIGGFERRISEFEREKQLSNEGLQSEITELRFQIKAKTDKARVLEGQMREAAEEMERLKERVRQDIRKIRVREKDLENRLEIMKKDSEALIGARESKIIELKRRLDLIEFNMDLLQDQYSREKENSRRLREKLAKAAQVVRVAGGLLDSGGQAEHSGTAVPEPGEDSGNGEPRVA